MPQTKIATAANPAGLGFAMPAEWEPHAATWLAWPHHEADWPGKMEAIRWVYGEMVRKISPGETVRLLVRHQAEKKFAASHLKRAGCDLKSVQFIVHPTNRGWMRDSGPIFLKRKTSNTEHRTSNTETAIVHFHFNAWAKDNHWRKDRKIPEMAAGLLGKKLFRAESGGKPFILEGGGIEVNGRGTLLTTEECYLHPKIQIRNPGMTKAEYDAQFKKYLGVKNILWLLKGPAGDDTHGHVDDICRFVDRKTLVLIRETNPRDINYRPLAENWERA
ncbi:MAG TPA: agmatine deiminase family protein, partial [Verrucomicrobiae bacterium]